MHTCTHTHTQVVNCVVNYVLSVNDVTFSEELLMVGNQCLMELSKCLQNHFAPSCTNLANFVIQQYNDPDLLSNAHTLSAIKLLMGVGSDCKLPYCVTMFTVQRCVNLSSFNKLLPRPEEIITIILQ